VILILCLSLLTMGLSLASAFAAGRQLAAVRLGRCPTVVPEPLPPDALAGATRAALEEAPALYRGIKLRGMRATKAVLAPLSPARGGYARKCGAIVHDRSVVVYLEFPAMKPSSSLSEGVVLLAPFHRRFRVWALLH
jgi:hypothetical protein